jgi:hypothetical protein
VIHRDRNEAMVKWPARRGHAGSATNCRTTSNRARSSCVPSLHGAHATRVLCSQPVVFSYSPPLTHALRARQPDDVHCTAGNSVVCRLIGRPESRQPPAKRTSRRESPNYPAVPPLRICFRNTHSKHTNYPFRSSFSLSHPFVALYLFFFRSPINKTHQKPKPQNYNIT